MAARRVGLGSRGTRSAVPAGSKGRTRSTALRSARQGPGLPERDRDELPGSHRRRAHLCYAAGIQSYDAGTLAELSAADCRFLDGTFFTAKELLALRPGAADAHAMGHLPVSGPGGSLEIISALEGPSIYIHINNTNPMVDTGSEASALVRKHGVEIAYDGMAFEL